MAEETALKDKLRALYEGDSRRGRFFRWSLVAFDLATISYFLVTAMVHPARSDIVLLNYLIAAVLIADYAARMIIAPVKWRYALHFTTIADVLVIISLVLPVFFENLAFLRVLRMLRLLRSYHLLRELRRFSPSFRLYEDVVNSAVNLAVFVFVVTAVVYVVEVDTNADIDNYMDALYFTVSTLTTTGFGDIVLGDPYGRVLAVVIMVFGVALFLRLVQTIFRPVKVPHDCPTCGLERHDPDAVHCKHCGEVLNIPTEGTWT